MDRMGVKSGFTLVEVMIVVAIIGIIVAIAVPGFMRAREVSRARACQANLQKVFNAKEIWAMENNGAAGDTVDWAQLVADDGIDMYLRHEPFCPAGGTYTLTAVGEDDLCDYSLPLWLDETYRHSREAPDPNE